MHTEIVELQDCQMESWMEKAGNIIKNGGLVAFPTETVYGLGGDALNPQSSQKIYAAKGRPSDNPLIVHISKFEDLAPIVSEIPSCVYALRDAFWPGPLTIIFKKSDSVPYETTGGLDTVAVRMPVDPIALQFIAASGGYVAAPSANLSGRPSPTKAQYVIQDLQGRVDMILDGGPTEIGLESTIVDVTGDVPMILRPGYITKEMLERVIGKVDVDPTIWDVACKERPKAPGMRYRHYAPKGDLTIIKGTSEQVISFINEKTTENKEQKEVVGVIATDETKDRYWADVVKSVGERQDEASIAHRLYTILREFDDEGITRIYSESFEEGSMGQAIMNRLLKAAGHHYISL